MEPMTLGSPVGSPISAPQIGLFSMNSGHGTTSSTPYYPAYLMGETQASISSRVPPGSISPGRSSRQFSTPVNTAISSPNSPQVSREAFFPTTRLGGDRPGGPPTFSLMGGLPQSPSSRIQSATFVEHKKIINSPYGAQPSGCSSPLFLTQHGIVPGAPYTPTTDGIQTTNSLINAEGHLREPLEDAWVTVFGFPVASASYILTQFAQLGTIIDQRLPGIGNWMHLKYQTKLQARKALTKHSKILNGNIMIGVISCTDQLIVGDKENVSLNASSMMSPQDSKLSGTPQTPKAHMRPLTQAYQASRADIEVTKTPNTPKKNDSLVAKAMQHILGI